MTINDNAERWKVDLFYQTVSIGIYLSMNQEWKNAKKLLYLIKNLEKLQNQMYYIDTILIIYKNSSTNHIANLIISTDNSITKG